MDEHSPKPTPDTAPTAPQRSPHEQEQEALLEKDRVSRRSFLMCVGIGLNGLVGLVLAVPVIGYLLGPVIKRKEYLTWIDLGPTSQFQPGNTKLISYRNPFSNDWDGETAKIPAYVRAASAGDFTVFAINCAHLGCPVRWFAESQLFMCPCHGGIYYADGSRASGPPERGLFTYPTQIRNGHLWIDAGQMPTLSNRAANSPCPDAGRPAPTPSLVTLSVGNRIEPCPGTNESTIG